MEKVLFKENQRMTLWLVVLTVIFTSGIIWYGFIQQLYFGIPFGTNPASDSAMIILWVLFGIGFPLFLLAINLKTVITETAITVQFKPFHIKRRTFLFSDIESLKVETYHPLKEFWGYGIRVNLKGATAYNVKGKTGIRICLKDGKEVLIGTQESEKVDSVLKSLRIYK